MTDVVESRLLLALKADLRTGYDDSRQQVVHDESVMKIVGASYRLYSTVEPVTDESLLIPVYSRSMTVFTEYLFRGLR